MKLVMLLAAFLFTNAVPAQDSWKVTHNGKPKLQTQTEDAAQNVFPISRTDLKQTGFLLVNYTDAKPAKGWKRYIALFDKKDNELLKMGGTTLKVSNPRLGALTNRVDSLFIYTWALPSDPKVAATVRIRRVHLATITLKDKEKSVR